MNVFLVLFSISFFIKNLVIDDKLPVFNSSQKQLSNVESSLKPVILIILDEYASPDELYKIKRDSAFYNFDTNLIKNGWVTRKSFSSEEKHTIKSLPSLFNLNLSKDEKFKFIDPTKRSSNKHLMALIRNNKLLNSFQNIKVFNYGLVGFNDSQNSFKSFKDFNPYETSNYLTFLDKRVGDFFGYSLVYVLHSRTRDLEKFKKDVLENLASLKYDNNSFYYFHVYAPHSPFIYQEEFEYLPINTDNYISFWEFTNRKIKSILDKNQSLKNSRIIITGDHGYREDSLINYKNTYGAFYGFNKETINEIETVQDIGILIKESFETNLNE